MDNFSEHYMDKLDEMNERLIRIEEYQRAHTLTHTAIDSRLNSHSTDLKTFRSFIDQWKGTVKMFGIFGTIGAFIVGMVYFIIEVVHGRW